MTMTAGDVDVGVGQLAEGPAADDLGVGGGRFDGGDRSRRGEAAGDEFGRDLRTLRHAHEHDDRAADGGERSPVDVGFTLATVTGDDGECS